MLVQCLCNIVIHEKVVRIEFIVHWLVCECMFFCTFVCSIVETEVYVKFVRNDILKSVFRMK